MAVAIFGFVAFTALCTATWITEERPSLKYILTGLIVVVLSFWAGWLLTE